MALPDLDDLIAEVDRTCDAAHVGTGQEQPDWLALLTVAAGVSGQLQSLADDLVEDYVEHCRMHGCSWTDIGTALGVTRQAVQQRFHAPHKRYAPETLTEDLRQALTHMKQSAIQHRNNFLGTEHLLSGLTAQENSATRLLESLGASPTDIHRNVGDRMSLGASQAAERIAWTPYSRKAIALAEELAAEEFAATEPSGGRAEGDGTPLIDCHHLLHGLARIGRGAAATVLTESGLNLTALSAPPSRT